jgi:Tfp pilus assembly protein PilX
MSDCYAKVSMNKCYYQRGQIRRLSRGLLSFISDSNKQRGQALLLVVLLITVVLTVAMSLMSRSIVNVRLSSEEDQSQKALSAAEAGIEKTLLANSAITNGTLSNNATFSTTYTQVNGNSFLLNNGKIVLKDEGADIWLSDYSPDSNNNYANPWTGTLSIYWGSSSDSCTSSESVNTMAALEIIVITGNRNNPVITHYAFDPCGSRRTSNSFNTPTAGTTIGSVAFAYSAKITLNTTGLIARVIPLYANTYIGIQGNPILPAQGSVIQSTGTSGDVKRTVSVLEQNPSLPVEFLTYSFLWPK